MKVLRTGFGPLALAIAVLAIPATASAGYLVPPENSAATQYTEALPTAGGPKDSRRKRHAHPSPAQVLGARNADRLRKHGAAGRAVAELSTETAPATLDETTPGGEGEPAAAGGASKPRGDAPRRADRPRSGERHNPPPKTEEPDGSSGIGEVISQATGSSSSDGLGLLLPLLLVGILAWAVAYRLQRRRTVTGSRR